MSPTTRQASIVARDISDHLHEQALGEVTLPVFATIFVCARIYLRRKHGLRLRLDDVCISLAVPLNWVLWAVWYWVCRSIIPTTVSAMKPQDVVPYLKATYANVLVYQATVFLIKFSMLFFYYHAFCHTRRLRIALYAVMSVTAAISLARILGTLLECRPIQDFWDDPQACSRSAWLIYVVAEPINVVAELALITFPMPVIWKLHTSLRKKIGITICFTLGFAVVAIHIARLWLLITSMTSVSAMASNSTIPNLTLQFLLETNVAVMTVCLPAIHKPLKLEISALRKRFQRQQSPVHTASANSQPCDSVPPPGKSTGEKTLNITVSSEIYDIHETHDNDDDDDNNDDNPEIRRYATSPEPLLDAKV